MSDSDEDTHRDQIWVDRRFIPVTFDRALYAFDDQGHCYQQDPLTMRWRRVKLPCRPENYGRKNRKTHSNKVK